MASIWSPPPLPSPCRSNARLRGSLPGDDGGLGHTSVFSASPSLPSQLRRQLGKHLVLHCEGQEVMQIGVTSDGANSRVASGLNLVFMSASVAPLHHRERAQCLGR